MKKYARIKTVEELQALATTRGFMVNTQKYDQGDDWITIAGVFGGEHMQFIYSTVNGRIIGKDPHYTDKETMFTSDMEDLDDQIWFTEILAFCYVSYFEAFRDSMHKKYGGGDPGDSMGANDSETWRQMTDDEAKEYRRLEAIEHPEYQKVAV